MELPLAYSFLHQQDVVLLKVKNVKEVISSGISKDHIYNYSRRILKFTVNQIEDLASDLSDCTIEEVSIINLCPEKRDDFASFLNAVRIMCSSCPSFIYHHDAFPFISLYAFKNVEHLGLYHQSESFWREFSICILHNKEPLLPKLRSFRGSLRVVAGQLYLPVDVVSRLLMDCPELEILDCSIAESLISLYDDKKKIKRLPNLKKVILGLTVTYPEPLDMEMSEGRAKKKAVEMAVDAFPEASIVHLVTSDYSALKAVKNFKSITDLSLCWEEDEQSLCFRKVVEPFLKKFSLKRLQLMNMMNVNVKTIGVCCPNLESLLIKQCEHDVISDTPEDKYFPSLAYLLVSEDCPLMSEYLQFIFRSAKKLHTVSLKSDFHVDCFVMTVRDYDSVCQDLVNLHLGMMGNMYDSKITFKDLSKAFQRLPKLKYVFTTSYEVRLCVRCIRPDVLDMWINCPECHFVSGVNDEVFEFFHGGRPVDSDSYESESIDSDWQTDSDTYDF